MRILNVFMEIQHPVALSHVAKKAGVATSTTHRYLVSLQRGGFVQQNADTGLYDLGPAALQLGSAAMRRLEILDAAEAAARNLAEDTGETAFISIWMEGGPMIIRWFHGRRIIITTAGIGAVLPIVGSSTGRVFAAYLPSKLTHTLSNAELKAGLFPLPKSKTFEMILEETRSEGFAWIDGLIVTGLRGVSAPIFNLQGNICATITLLSQDPALVSFPNNAVERLLQATRDASQKLGYFQPT
jgi:DNA-binding IclR family transcriptional regulator